MDGGSARGSRLIRSATVVEPATVRSVRPKWKATTEQKKILESIFLSGLRHPSMQDINRITVELQCHGPVESKNVAYWFQNTNAKEKRMNGQPERGNRSSGSRLIRSASVVEPATVRSICPKWKATAEQKKILESIFLSGLRHPSVQDINRITVELQCHGPVESKNVAYWFQNTNAKEKRMNGRPETGTRLTRSSSSAESASHGRFGLGSSYVGGTNNPPLEPTNNITAELQSNGPVRGKNIPAKSISASKWSSVFKPRTWTLFGHKFSSSKNSTQEEVASGARRNSSEVRRREMSPLKSVKSSGQEEQVRSGGRRNSSADQYEIRTLDLFPLHPGH